MTANHFRFSTLVFSAVLFFCISAQSQDTTNTIGRVSIASPTAASLGKYGDIPISYNTGLPNISIPVYTVEAGSLKLPISLSYHASGLKVQEQASWVGAGWALNAGGVITRTVIGGPDDRGVTNFNSCTHGHYSDYGFSSYEFINDPGMIGDAYDGYFPDDNTFCQGYKDAEPDLYFFNFGSYSGKFYFNDDRTPVLVPDADFKIKADLNNGTGGMGFQGFTITTSDGVKYYFGMTGNNKPSCAPVEITVASTIQNGPANSNMAVSSWFLNKIVSADGVDSITLTYQPETFSAYTTSMFPISNIATGGPISPAQVNGYSLIKNFIQGVRLDSIYFPNGSVAFIKSTSPRMDLCGYSNQGFYDAPNTSSYALGSIKVQTAFGFCKKDSLYTSYFQDNINTLNGLMATYSVYNIHSDTYRLRLDSMQEYSCDLTAKIPPHKFTYFSELVPRKLSFGIDHWGFYNGVTTNTGLIPSFTLTTGVANAPIKYMTGANRDASWPAMRGGSLQQITYPTGGFTRFVFQPNDTYCSYTAYTPVIRAGLSVGYDGSTVTTSSYTSSANQNSFQVTLTSNQSSGTGNFEILNSVGTIIQNIPALIGGTDTAYFILSPSTAYTLKLFNNSSQGTGYGITATLTEIIPSMVNANVIVGGLRIDTLTSQDNVTGNNIITIYTYTNGGTQSSGIVYSRPVYVQSLRNDVYGWVYQPITGTPGCIPNAATYYISPSSITPMSTVQGNHIGYNQVQVSQSNNGYSIYRYYGSNYWDYIVSDVCTRALNTSTCTTSIPNFPQPALPFDPMRGELKYEGHFNQSGQVLRDVTYTPAYISDSLTTPAHMYISIPGLYSFTPYKLQSARKAQTVMVETLYDPTHSGSVTTTSTTYFVSLYHNEVTRKVSTTSSGDSVATNMRYAFDFRIASCDAVSDSLPYYINSANADSSQFFLHLGSCSASNWACRMDTLSNMRRNLGILHLKFMNYRLRSFSDTGSISKCYLTAENTADTLLKPVLRLKDEYSNPVIEQTNWRDNMLLHASFTRYDSSLSPVGFTYPGKMKMVSLQSPSSSFTNAAISGSSIQIDSRYLDEATYQFKKGNPLQVTGRNGITTSYIWDYLNQEPVAKTVGAANNQTAFTSFEADGNGNWTVPSASRDLVNFYTGNKSYNLSSGSVAMSGLSIGTIYIVSYWSKGSSYTISGGTGTVRTGRTVSPWTYYEHTVTASSSTITVSGSGDIDELRLYPAGAQMTSYTYQPGYGMTTMNDPNSEVTYYTYDALTRLKTVKDYQGNIIKDNQYNYPDPNACGGNCEVLTMQTFAGTNTLSYPVGVFNVNGKFLSNATNQTGYISAWMSDTADSHTGTIVAGADSMHFKFTVNSGRVIPNSVTGCRYYQFDLSYTNIDAIRNFNGTYVDFGDGTGMHLGLTIGDSNVVRAPNTTINAYSYINGPANANIYWNHSYPDSTLKTISFYHNDGIEQCNFDNGSSPASSLTHLKNFRGNLPQNTQSLFPTCFQQANATTVASITNWNTLTGITLWGLRTGDEINPCLHISYAQDFMANNKNLQSILTDNLGPYLEGYEDTTFKISRLKSNWNTYFTNLTTLEITDKQWNREDLTALTQLSVVGIGPGNTLNSYNHTGNSLIAMPTSAIDNIINQISAGAGQNVLNGILNIPNGGGTRSSASDAAVAKLKAKGWTVIVNGINQ
jgi:hypothetical protein